MKRNLTINALFAYSESNNKYFHTEFSNGVNIIHGKNTSGKSTIFQTILYAFGINDNNQYLKEVLEEDIFIRIDCSIRKDDVVEKVIFIREDQSIFIKKGKSPVLRFNGINADHSREHIKLKVYIHELFGFSLSLESKNEYKSAPIETMFLPYYIPQSVGWVYLRKSFSNLQFYKNFREDYLDYYLGIETFVDRERKQELEKKLRNKEEEIKFYEKIENKDEFQITKLVDEQFIEESIKYIESHKDNQKLLNKEEQAYISKCNELSYHIERQRLLQRVSINHKEQNPIGGICPTCEQKLDFSLAASYKYFQEENDTKEERKKHKEKIKEIQSQINSIKNNLDDRKLKVEKEYELLKRSNQDNISFDTWMENKVNRKLIGDISHKLRKLDNEKAIIKDSIKEFKTEEEVEKSRQKKNREFSKIFPGFLNELGVEELEERRYKILYDISAFPYQGVELHKTILAYNFALNKLISKTENIHRFPFMLDAIFKEDIEQENKNTILKFIGKNKPKDTQLILSIAETKESVKNIVKYNDNYFDGEAKLICIGKGIKIRAFLGLYDGSHENYLEESLNIINGENN